MIYTLDTNILIDALRRPAELVRLKQFLEWALPHTVLSSVVASELLAGARTETARRLVERDLLSAFERRGRIIAPNAAAWAKTGWVLGQATTAAIGHSWQNDLLLAHSARAFGWRVITRDKDFSRIRTLVKGLAVEAPFPRRPTIARDAE